VFSACSVSQDQETAIGRQNAEEINAQLPIVTDPAVSSYIQDLGESIAKTMHAHPTLSEAMMEAGEDVAGHSIHQ